MPTGRALLATYDFLDCGAGLTNVNDDGAIRNSLLLDLNGGPDPNAFASQAAVTVIFGTNGSLDPKGLAPTGHTPTRVVRKVGPSPGDPPSRPYPCTRPVSAAIPARTRRRREYRKGWEGIVNA